MKKFLNLCLALCLLCGLNGVHSVNAEEGQTGDDEIIKCNDQGIPDPALYAAVLEAGDRNKDGILTKAEAEGIRGVYAYDGEIKNLQGIEKLINLTQLELSSSKITDLKELWKLTNLTHLYLNGSNITNIQGIEKLTNLTYLDLSGTGITSLKDIEKLTNLTYLDLRGTNITCLQGIENLSNLTYLDLGWSSITNLQGIENLTNLTNLQLYRTGITSFQGVDKLTNLTDLDMDVTGITSVKGIENLTNLTSLRLSRTDITSFQGIENLTNLTSLNLSDTKITSMKGIENLTNLTFLDLSNTGITSFQGIENLTNLTSLILSDTGITNIKGIENLTNLAGLYLSNTAITNIKGIENLTNLVDLDISYNGLSELPDLTKLVKINSGNMTELEGKLVDGNKILTEEFLIKLPKHIADKIGDKKATASQYEINLKVNEPVYYYDACLNGSNDEVCETVINYGLKLGLKDEQGNINYNEKFKTYVDDWNIVMTGEVKSIDYSYGIDTEHIDFEAFDNAMKEYWSTSNSKYAGTEEEVKLYRNIIKKYNLSKDVLGDIGSWELRRGLALVPIRAGSTYVTFSNGFYAVKVKVNVVDDTDDNTVDKPSDDNVDKPGVNETKPKHEFVNSDDGIPTDTSDKLHDDNVLGMTINMPNSDTATADIFQALKETGKNLTFNVKGENDRTKYSWTFEGNDIKNPDMDLDLSINFETEKQQEIQNITNQSNMFYISFVHHGELPGRAKIKVDVSDKFKDGDYIYLYYYNEEKGTIERKGQGYRVKDGYAEFEIDHCSVYFFTKEPVKTDSKKDSNMIKNTATDGSQSNASTIVLAVIVLGLLGFVVIKNKATE